jgi:hypothetical protein
MERATVYLIMLAALLISAALLITDVPALLGPRQFQEEVVFASEYNDIARDMATDSRGNIVVVGGRWESRWSSSSKFYVLKTSPEGQLEWSKIWNVTEYDMVEIDSQDSIIIAGVTGVNQDETSCFIMKLDPEGELVWQVEFPGIKYDWHWWPEYSDCIGLAVDAETDNIYVAGSLVASRHQTIVAALNSSGVELWQTTWEGPSDSNGTDVTTMWLSSKEGIIISGGIYKPEVTQFEYEYTGFYLAAFDVNGTARWNRTSSLIWTGFDTNEDEFVTATASWRGYNQVTLYEYNDGGVGGCTVDVGDYYTIRIQGFCMNGSEHIIGFGRVESLIVAAPVTRGFSARFQGPQAPQTLIVSCDPTGDLEWYDYLILGTMSEPCGVVFDSEGSMIIVGHTCAYSLYQNDFFIVFGFQHTPFPPDYQILLLGFFPLFNIIILGLLSELRRLHENGKSFLGFHSTGMTYRRAIWRLFQVELILFLLLYIFPLGTSGGGGPPSLVSYMPGWMQTLLLSIPFGILVLGFLYLVLRSQSGRSSSPQSGYKHSTQLYGQ